MATTILKSDMSMTSRQGCSNRAAKAGSGWGRLSPAWFAWLLLAAPAAWAQPLNDAFTNAYTLFGPAGSTSGSVVGATRELGEPFSYYSGTVWYRWTAPASGRAEFDTYGSYQYYNYLDSALTVFSGTSLTNLTQLAIDDDTLMLDAYVTFPVTGGSNYYIRVDGYYGYSSYYYGGYFVLNWNLPGAGTNALGTNQVQFTSPAYSVPENAPGFVIVSVDYGGGAAGNVSVDYTTTDASAVAGVDYMPRSGTLVFGFGETNQVFTVPILDNAVANSNKTFNILLSNPQGGATLGAISATAVTIVDDETPLYGNMAGQIQFSASPYYSNYAYYVYGNSLDFYRGTETENYIEWSANDRCVYGVMCTVTRTNGCTGRVMVDYYTTNSFLELGFGRPAVAGYDYSPVSGTLILDDYQMSTNFVVPVGYGYTTTGYSNNAAFTVVLANPRAAPEENSALIQPTLGLGATSVVQVVNVSDFPYQFSFSRLHYRVDEYGGAYVRVGINLPSYGGNGISVDIDVWGYNGTYYRLEPGSDWAIVNNDYQNASGTVSFGDRDTEKWVDIHINDDALVEFNEDIVCYLWNAKGEKTINNVKYPVAVNQYANWANVTILFDDQPPGAADREWNPEQVTYTTPPFNLAPGANNVVRAVAVQADGKTLLGGDFTHVNTVSRNHIARMNLDGSLDLSFMPGSGANSFVRAIALYNGGSTNPVYQAQAGRLLIAGGFTSYNGVQRNGLARLNSDGSLDSSFNIGAGADGPVRAVAVLPDGRVYVAGQFNHFDAAIRHGVARLNPDGSLDPSFDPGYGADGSLWSIALADPLSPESKLLLGGNFSYVNGLYHSGLARLNPDGTLDSSFSAGGGANADVYSLAVQADGKILAGGAFTQVDFRPRSGVVRLNPDGSMDAGFSSGSGTDDAVFTIALQADGKPYLGGIFTSYNGTRRVGLARLNLDGTLDTTFLDTAYNQFAGLIKKASTDAAHFVNAIAFQPDGMVMIGGSFTNLGGNAARQINNNSTYNPVWTRQDKVTRFNIARLINSWGAGNPSQGPGNAQFAASEYTVDENGTRLNVTLQRVNGSLGTLQVQATTADRTALAGINYLPVNTPQVWPQNAGFQLSQGYTGLEYIVVPIVDNQLVEGDRTVTLRLSQPYGGLFLGGEVIPLGGALGVADANMTIGEDDFLAGGFNFSAPAYQTNENARFAVISVLRTNGSTGTATVDYYARAGSAVAGRDFTAVAGTLTFDSAVVAQTFQIPIFDNGIADLDKTVIVVLTNATGGSTLPGGLATSSATATLTIIDSDYPPGRLGFTVGAYTNSENDTVARISVSRLGGNVQRLTVQCATVPATGLMAAVLGQDYLATNVTLAWDHLDSAPKYLEVPLLKDRLVDGWKHLRLALSNPSLSGALGSRSTADLWIADADAYGTLNLSQNSYYADENGGPLTVTVVRSGGTAGTVSVDYATTAETAVPGPAGGVADYQDVAGTLVFTNGQSSATFPIPLWDDLEADGDKAVLLALSRPTNATLGSLSNASLTILDNETMNIPAGSLDVTYNLDAQANGPIYALALQPDGRLLLAGDFTTVNHITRNHVARLKDNGQLDGTFDSGTGPNAAIRAMVLQPDGKVLLGGQFSAVNNTNRGGIARLSPDGTIDGYFDPGAGTDGPVFAMALQPDGRILIGGSFGKFNTLPCPAIARLNPQGALDASFIVGSGPDGTVNALVLQPDGKVVIGGDFTRVNGQASRGLARLNPDGSVDASFNVGTGPDAPVRALAVQWDGQIVVGGSFTNFNGVPRHRLARLNPNGSLDTGFLSGQTGGDGAVYTLALQTDGRILVAGDFTTFNGVTRNRLTRLNPDGSTDVTINFGGGANSFVAALALEPNRKIILGGGFTLYDDQPRQYLARINGGSIMGAGALDFNAALYQVGESSSNALIWVRRTGGTAGTVWVDAMTLDGSAQSGLDYLATNRTLVFPPGETRQSFLVPVLNRPQIQGDRDFYVMLDNFQGGATNGWQPFATVRVRDEDSRISFLLDNFTVSKDVYTGQAAIGVIREGATNSTVSVQFWTTNSTAVAGVNYVATNATITFLPGETLHYVTVGILSSTNYTGQLRVGLRLTAPGPTLSTSLGLSNATLTILDTRLVPGALGFETNEYAFLQTEGSATLTVLRTNGNSGVVWVSFATVDGTGLSGRDYRGTNGVLVFADGETSRTLSIPILQTATYQGDRTFQLRLSAPQGGASLATYTNALVTIREDRTPPAAVSFLTADYTVNESDGFASITVKRFQNLASEVSVGFSTADGSALAGFDYLGTNGVLHFASNEAFKIFDVPILNDALVQPTHTVLLVLTNVSTNGVLRDPTVATLSILDDDTSVGFSAPAYFTPETNDIVIPIVRLGLTNQPLLVSFATLPGTAQPGANYFPTNGSFVFASGQVTQTFLLRVRDDGLVTGDKTVRLVLSNLVGEAVLGQSNALVTIIESTRLPGSLFFSALNYSVSELGTNAILTVLRTNGTSGAVALDYFPTAGSAVPGLDYIPIRGTLTFPDGVTNQDIVIPIRGRNAVEGNRDFTISLANLVGGAVLAGPATVTVTILDAHSAPGSLVQDFDIGAGADGLVLSVAAQPDGKILVGGAFSNFNSVRRRFVTRLQTNGAVDLAFNTSNGANSLVTSVAAAPELKVALGGVFTNYGAFTNHGVLTNIQGVLTNVGAFTNPGLGLYRVARLNDDATIDTNFLKYSQLNGQVNALAVQPDSKIIVGGVFTQPSRGVARFRKDGSLDASFDVGQGADGMVHALALQANGQLFIAGTFTAVDGFPRSRIARLNDNGSIDQNFLPPDLIDGFVYALAVQPDGKVVLGGEFMQVGGLPLTRLARLNPDGSVDPTFQPGAGANNTVYALAVQPDGGILVGGNFTAINTTNLVRYARLRPNGAVDPVFQPGRGADNTVYSIALLPGGDIILGGAFHTISGSVRNGVARLYGRDYPPFFTSIEAAAGQTRLSLTVMPGKNYVLQETADLKNWRTLSTNRAFGSSLLLTPPQPAGSNHAIYRVRMDP